MNNESVGSLLAVIANSLNDALRTMMFADKRGWGPDEFEQLRMLEETLDEAKKDFQELPALVNGRFYYEHDRNSVSIDELRGLAALFELHAQNFREWMRDGGPVNPMWARETIRLRRDLHRAQCRAARRIHDAEQETPSRCLGALQVYRVQRPPEAAGAATKPQQQQQQQLHRHRNSGQDHNRPRHLEELRACNETGHFERFDDKDIAFVCDFCDGYIVWEDLREMPTARAGWQPPARDPLEPLSTTTTPTKRVAGRSVAGMGTATATMTTAAPQQITRTATETATTTSTTSSASTTQAQTQMAAPDQWQATGFARTSGAEKTVVFAPVAIANHLPPEPGDWLARILCPFCEEYYYEEPGDDELERVRYTQDEGGFADLAAFQEHLEWYHTSLVPSASKCSVM
ncbi:hypothetical protein DL766_001592 [Monosporascus sp. MC13-8B]|uniref:Uncharacterized protein n=1 Tax=Monosporascus cannonballus TaxID=155416 RepID=A0ABY0HJH3_9PEZI|nr:hypothetical protein DL763_006593 [Monosporascus cannonballus]RYO94474.1 hypothetical protein DL762_000570 [Monosporascus cannonballus]RYP37282.1 hypothetical protein DL766_001592 [Monosporascus sp. MC13-8B]